jgi:hypothetical protein
MIVSKMSSSFSSCCPFNFVCSILQIIVVPGISTKSEKDYLIILLFRYLFQIKYLKCAQTEVTELFPQPISITVSTLNKPEIEVHINTFNEKSNTRCGSAILHERANFHQRYQFYIL